jgi:hypothetical protein
MTNTGGYEAPMLVREGTLGELTGGQHFSAHNVDNTWCWPTSGGGSAPSVGDGRGQGW